MVLVVGLLFLIVLVVVPMLERHRPDVTGAEPEPPELVHAGAHGIVAGRNGLAGRPQRECPWPGLPVSVKGPKPGSPVKSLGSRVMVHPVGSPTRLFPNEVTMSVHSFPRPPLLRARIVFCKITGPPWIPPPGVPREVLFSVIVALSRS